MGEHTEHVSVPQLEHGSGRTTQTGVRASRASQARTVGEGITLVNALPEFSAQTDSGREKTEEGRASKSHRHLGKI